MPVVLGQMVLALVQLHSIKKENLKLRFSFLFNYILFWICIFGLCFGSFYNVVILRSLSEESLVFPASKCPHCQTKLKPWHNIPVISYILLGGKCAFCKDKISIQYPLIELITMGLFAWCFRFKFKNKQRCFEDFGKY